MSDETNIPGWRKKFLANRMSFESILFERELVMPKKEKISTGLLVSAGICLFYALLLAQWVLRRGYFFVRADAESFKAVLHYAAYMKSQGWWALLKPELAASTLNPPLYYLAYVPVLKYLTSDLNLALIAVNTFFMLVLALSVFLSVRKNRPNRAGWLGVAFVLAMPFVMELARRPAPEMALIAICAAVYACYIQSDDFEHPKWTFWFSIFLGLGFFSHRLFLLYMLPLVPFIVEGSSNPLSREELMKGLFPGIVINLPWYLFAGAAAAAGFVPLWGAYQGFDVCLDMCVSAAGLPLFTLGFLALAWMYFSVFMPYEKKKIVTAWFWFPMALIWLGARGNRPELVYPALIPFAIALPVMTPHFIRKYLFVFVLLLGAVNQSGFVPPLSMHGYQVAGLPLPPARAYHAAEILAAVKSELPPAGGFVGIYGSDSNLNADSLRFAALKAGEKTRFENDPVCPACPAVLINKTTPTGAPASRSERDFAGLKETPWFPVLFEKKSVIELADASKAEIYVKAPLRGEAFKEGSYGIRRLVLGKMIMEDVTLKVEGYNASSASYATGELFVPTASALGGDIYGLTLALNGVELAGTAQDPVLAGVKSVKVASAKISAYALERYLADRFPSLSEVKVELNDTLFLSAVSHDFRLAANFSFSMESSEVIEIRPVAFSFGPVTVPDILLKLFSFRLDLSDNPYGLNLSGLRIRDHMLEVF